MSYPEWLEEVRKAFACRGHENPADESGREFFLRAFTRKLTPSDAVAEYLGKPTADLTKPEGKAAALTKVAAMVVAVFGVCWYIRDSQPDESVAVAPSVPSSVIEPPLHALAPDDSAEKAQVVVLKNWKWHSDRLSSEYEHCEGSVRNNATRPVRYWKVTAQFKDKSGQIIDTACTNSNETLLPGAQKRFDIEHARLAGEERADCFVEEVQLGD